MAAIYPGSRHSIFGELAKMVGRRYYAYERAHDPDYLLEDYFKIACKPDNLPEAWRCRVI